MRFTVFVSLVASVLPLFVGSASAFECASVHNERQPLIRGGIEMHADARNGETDTRGWSLNAGNWQGAGPYPYGGLDFMVVTMNDAIDVIYEITVNEVVKQNKVRKFYVKFENVNSQSSPRTYYINSGDFCSKKESNDALTTKVILYEYN